MARRDTVGVGLIGSQFISTIHAESLRAVPAGGHARRGLAHARQRAAFAERHAIPHHFTDYRRDARAGRDRPGRDRGAQRPALRVTLDAAAAGKHVVFEKPLCLNLAEADRMIDACRQASVKLMYAEELCFTPKYVRLKQLLDERRARPADVCQAVREARRPARRRILGRRALRRRRHDGHGLPRHRVLPLDARAARPSRSVYAQMSTNVHGDKTRGDDNAILILEFDGGVTAMAEESWTKPGGMDDRAEVHGSHGVAYADLLHGNAIETYSAAATTTRSRRPGSTKGWSFTIYEEAWNYGFHAGDGRTSSTASATTGQPLVTGEDGRAVLEVLSRPTSRRARAARWRCRRRRERTSPAICG